MILTRDYLDAGFRWWVRKERSKTLCEEGYVVLLCN